MSGRIEREESHMFQSSPKQHKRILLYLHLETSGEIFFNI